MDENAHDMDCTNSQPDTTQIPIQYTECTICSRGGKLLCCDGKGCGRSFHLSCVDPPLTCFPPGVWHCIWCIKKIIHYGVHSVSEGIESILGSREVISHDEVTQSQKQYLVKYKGLAHVHNRWIPEREMLLEAPILLARFKNKTKGKAEWSVPLRLIQKRLLVFPEHCDDEFQGHDGNYSDCRYMWLVKWTGLSYSNATWELENSSFLKTPEAMKLIRDYETRHQKSQSPQEIEGRKVSSPELKEFPFGRSNGQSNSHLSYVNILRGYLYRGQNAVVFDVEERIVKVVLFILSLLKDTRQQPFLIITPSDAISLWEAEFNNWASSSSASIVVYNGNNDVRASIRHLEFYNEGGSLMFQILLSPPDVVDKDLEMIGIKWEAIIVDECQRRQIYLHLKKFKKLAADMRLLLISCEVKDKRFNYHDALLLLDPEFDGIDEDYLESDTNLDISKLKERFSQFVAFECKSGASEFAEYWVPIHLSDVQVEQYCNSLLSNSTWLCSSSKNDSVDSLREILPLNRKCCDHPYLVDRSLQSTLTSDIDVVDHLDVGINVSGKLQLLEKILLEIKTRGLRVLLFFQSDSGPITIGDILDDIIRGRFGEDSYVRVDGEIKRWKRKAALNSFNNKESGNFVCLIDNHACLPHVKLSSVDVVVILDSDWNPINDLRALQKITISSQFQPVKVFRLYSPFTLEEKVLTLNRQGTSLDSNIQYIGWRNCQKLLRWGAFRLFKRLDDSNGYENTLSNDVFRELSALLLNNGENDDPFKCSLISSVEEKEGTYCTTTSLLSENEEHSINNFVVNERANVFWTNLLEGRNPRDKYVSSPSQRSRRKVKRFDGVLESLEYEEGSFENKRPKTHNFDLIAPPRRQRNLRKVRPRVQEREPAEILLCNEVATCTIGERPFVESLPTIEFQIVEEQIMQAMWNSSPSDQLHIPYSGNNELLESSPVTSECLDPSMERAQKDKEELIRNHEERKLKLISECDREIAEIRKKYDGMLQEAELAFLEEKKDLEMKHKLAYYNKHLANAVAIQQGDVIAEFMDDIVQQYIQNIVMNEQLKVVNPTVPTPQVPSVVNRQTSSSSSVWPTVATNTFRTEQSLELAPMATGSSPVTPVVNHLTVFQQSAATPKVIGAPPEPGRNRSSAVRQTGSDYTPLTIERCSPSLPSASPPLIRPWHPLSPLPPGPLTVPTIQGSGGSSVGGFFRAPAPHLRYIRPPPVPQQMNPQHFLI